MMLRMTVMMTYRTSSAKAWGKISAQRGENDPGDHDTSGAQNGENVENSDQQRHQNRTVHADEGQTNG